MSYIRPSVSRRSLSGITSGPRGSRVSRAALDGAPSSLPSCDNVPVGTPCLASDGTPLFVSGPQGSPPSSGSGMTIGDWALYGVLGFFAYKTLFK